MWIPQMLTRAQLDIRFKMCRENLHVIEMDLDYLKQVTCDESWVHYFEPKTWQKVLPGRRFIAEEEKGEATGIGGETHAHGLL